MRIPDKLKQGDEIRIIAPTRSASILSEEGVQLAKEQLENLGFTVTFGKHVFDKDLRKLHRPFSNGWRICMTHFGMKM